MPNEDGKLSMEEFEKAKKWLEERKAVNPCPLCGNKTWSISEQLAVAPVYSTRILMGAGFPAVVILCSNCFFFRWHSAIVMGIVPTKVKPEPEEVKHGA